MNLYTSLTLRYLKKNKKRTIVTIIGIILSTSLICGIGNIFSSLINYNIRETIKDKGNFHATIYDVNKENINYVSKSVGISKYGISDNLGFADTGDMTLLRIKEYDETCFDSYQVSLKEGRLPNNKNEIVVSENSKLIFENEYKIGDKITLSIGDRVNKDGEETSGISVYPGDYIKDARNSTFEIVGIINRPGFEYGNEVTTAITYMDYAKLTSDDKVNISITANNPKDIYTIVPKICKNIGMDIEENAEDDAYYETVEYNENLLRLQGASIYENIDSTMTSIVLLVTSLVIICTVATVYNAFSISISERKKQFGILNSIGATNRQIIKLVLIEGILVSVISLPIGLISGTVAIDVVFKFIQKFFRGSFIAEMNLEVVYNPAVIIISTIVILITIFTSVILPARTASKVSPLEAIKNSGDYKIGKVKNSKLIKRVFKTEGVLAYKNLRRNKKKFRITLFSLIISVVIFISFSGFMNLFLKAETIRTGSMTYDMYMYSMRMSKEISENLIKDIKNIEGINNINAQCMLNIYMDIDEDKINQEEKEQIEGYWETIDENGKKIYKTMNNTLEFPGDKGIERLKLTEGSLDKDKAILENGVILTNKSYYEDSGKKGVIDMTNYKVGDMIEVYTIKYDDNGDELKDKLYKLKVMGITEDILPGNYNYSYMGVNLITYDEVGEKLGLNVSKDSIYIDSDRSEETRAKVKALAEKYRCEINDESEESLKVRDSFMSMQIFVYGFVSVISLVSITNIVNTISTNINLRKKELAIIQSIGVTPYGFNKMIYIESFLYGALSLIYGIPIGLGLTIFMNNILGDVIQFGLILPWNAVILCIICVFIMTFIASYIPMKKINKENIIDNIRQESI